MKLNCECHDLLLAGGDCSCGPRPAGLRCFRHDDERWDERRDQWVCVKCGARRPVIRDTNGWARPHQNWRVSE